MCKVTIIIPTYNEEPSIQQTISELLDNIPIDYELIIVNDGSDDGTWDIVKKMERENSNIYCYEHKKNKGYGAAIKTGCKYANGELIAWYDADGQHRPEDLHKIVNCIISEKIDYCIGMRDKRSFCERKRIIGKKILNYIVNILAKEKMPDFNSGLRVFRKDILVKILPLLPQRFGASTVTSFLMQELGYAGRGVPIVVRKRVGKSTVKIFRDGIRTISLILNIIILFRPKEVFGTIGFIFILIGIIYGVTGAIAQGLGIPVLAAIICITGVQILFFGIISSQISQMRLEKYID